MQITLRTAHQKRAHYHTLTPLNPFKTWFEALSMLLKDCLPLASNPPSPPPLFLTPCCILTPSFFGGKPPFYDQEKVRFDLIRDR